MKTHELKINPEYFADTIADRKQFEVRLNDRDYEVGDEVILKEYELQNPYVGIDLKPEGNYTGFLTVVKITYILNDQKYVKDGYIIFGHKRMTSAIRYKFR